MSEWIELTAGDGHRLQAWQARPDTEPRGAIVVIQEIFGVNSHVRAVADDFAAQGYLAIAPALFDRSEPGIEMGYDSADVQRGIALKGAVGNDKALLDVAAAVAHGSRAGRVGVVGYCWGGLLAWLAAAKLDGLAAAVTYYGGGMPDQASLTPKVPVLAHFGDKDQSIPMAGVEKFRAAQPGVELHVYAAGHGFNCDQRGAYDAASARLARERTLAFFAQHLR